MDTYNIWNKKLRIYETTIDINSTKAVFAAWWPQGGRRISNTQTIRPSNVQKARSFKLSKSLTSILN